MVENKAKEEKLRKQEELKKQKELQRKQDEEQKMKEKQTREQKRAAEALEALLEETIHENSKTKNSKDGKRKWERLGKRIIKKLLKT